MAECGLLRDDMVERGAVELHITECRDTRADQGEFEVAYAGFDVQTMIGMPYLFC
jgi:hypothetical protein